MSPHAPSSVDRATRDRASEALQQAFRRYQAEHAVQAIDQGAEVDAFALRSGVYRQPPLFLALQRMTEEGDDGDPDGWARVFVRLCDAGANVQVQSNEASLWHGWVYRAPHDAPNFFPELHHRLHAAGLPIDAPGEEDGVSALGVALTEHAWLKADTLVELGASATPQPNHPFLLLNRLLRAQEGHPFDLITLDPSHPNTCADPQYVHWVDWCLAHLTDWVHHVDADGVSLGEAVATGIAGSHLVLTQRLSSALPLMQRLEAMGFDWDTPCSNSPHLDPEHRTVLDLFQAMARLGEEEALHAFVQSLAMGRVVRQALDAPTADRPRARL